MLFPSTYEFVYSNLLHLPVQLPIVCHGGIYAIRLECVSLCLNIYRVSGLNALGFPVSIVRTLIFRFFSTFSICTYALLISCHCPVFVHLSLYVATFFSTRNLIALHPLGHFRTISCVSDEPDEKPQM